MIPDYPDQYVIMGTTHDGTFVFENESGVYAVEPEGVFAVQARTLDSALAILDELKLERVKHDRLQAHASLTRTLPLLRHKAVSLQALINRAHSKGRIHV